MFTQEHISKFRTLIRMRMNSNPIYPTSRGDDDDDEWVNRKLIPKLPTHIFTGMSPSVICIVIQMRRRRKIFRENATQPNHNQHHVGRWCKRAFLVKKGQRCRKDSEMFTFCGKPTRLKFLTGNVCFISCLDNY